CRTGLGCCYTGEHFQRSNETIKKCFRKMVFTFSGGAFYSTYVTLPTSWDPPASYLRNNPKFWPFFDNGLGAMDGSHIACTASKTDRSNARNRK
ncbi:hypothetical protein DFH08DRAFT_614523, partial [Mycena albidolilacea]